MRDRTSKEARLLLAERWFKSARILWLILAVLVFTLWLIGTLENSTSVPAACAGGTCDPFALSAGDLAALAQLGLPVGFIAGFFVLSNIGIALAFFTIGAAIAWRKSADWMGLLVSFTLVYLGAVFFTDSDDALWRAYPASRSPLTLLGMVGYAAIMLLLFYFPDGRFVPHGRTARDIGWLIILLTAPFVGTATRVGAIGTFPLLATVSLGLGAQIYRYRRASGPEQRQQTKWVVFGLATSLAVMLIWVFAATTLPPGSPSEQRVYFLLITRPLISVLIPLLPLTIALSILRYRLWDVDMVINRTLVYGMLTACVIATFVLIVGGLGTLFQSQGNPLIALLATGLVAVLFQPLRERLQRGVNRLVYGERDDPLAALSQLGRRLEAALAPEIVLSTLVETIAQTLKLPFVAISLRAGEAFKIAARSGSEGADTVSLPLIYQGESVGQLIVAPREPGESFSKIDRRLLENIAHQAGPAVRTVQLTVALQHSRRQLVTTREEERRRLRRDLHDGLGATLAALNLEAGALRRSIRSDPEKAEALAEEFRQDIRASIEDIRHLVYELRPPTLDQLGLVEALRAQASQCNRPDERADATLQVEVEAPETLPPLPAAVEVAAYRIVQEALTNVVHHAQAQRCQVRLEIADELMVEVVDDGVGVGDGRSRNTGLGLLSMRERAEELGGCCLIEPVAGGGTRVLASLPLPET